MPDSGAVLKTELRGSPYKLGIRAERRKGGAVNSKDGNSRYHQLSQSRLESCGCRGPSRTGSPVCRGEVCDACQYSGRSV